MDMTRPKPKPSFSLIFPGIIVYYQMEIVSPALWKLSFVSLNNLLELERPFPSRVSCSPEKLGALDYSINLGKGSHGISGFCGWVIGAPFYYEGESNSWPKKCEIFTLAKIGELLMAEIYKGAERRKYPRLDESVPVLYHAAEDTSLDYISKVASSTTENISGGGFCFEAEVYVPPDSTLEVQINKTVDEKLKAVLPVHANAKVIWIKQVDTGKYKLGLQFVEISQHHRDEIRRNVEQKLKQERSK